MPEEIKFLSPKEICEKYGLNEGTMANHRHLKTGPTFYKINKKILYKVSDIEEWISSGKHEAREYRRGMDAPPSTLKDLFRAMIEGLSRIEELLKNQQG